MKTELIKKITFDINDIVDILKQHLKLEGDVKVDFKEEEVTYNNYKVVGITLTETRYETT